MASEKRSQEHVYNKENISEVKKVENNNEGGLTNLIKQSSHPTLCIFTILFKIGAVVSFLIIDIVLDSDALAYLIVIILGAMDFWLTKNISGRLLVGLRWWNEVREDGSEVWVFESKNEGKIKII